MIDQTLRIVRSSLALAAFGLAAISLPACSSDEAGDPSTAVGSAGLIEFHAEPAREPAEGENAFHVELRDAASRDPMTGATLKVSAVMPSMGHEAPGDSVVTEVGGGVYDVDDLVFSMPGLWEVRYRASKDDLTDEAAFRYEVR